MKGTITGIVATVVGGVLLVIVLGILGLEEGPTGPGPGPEPITFVIRDRLGPQRISEELDVSIEGDSAGTLMANQSSPSDEITHTVSDPGEYRYTVSARGLFLDAYGNQYELMGTGEGTIEVHEGSAFELRESWSGNTWQIYVVDD